MKPYLKTYDCGLRLCFKKVESTRPATIEVLVKTGSNNEDSQTNGISHLIEHLNFKGTSKRTAKQISVEFEEIGVNANAYTGKNNTCFYATGLNESMEKCFEIMSDIVFNSSYKEADIEREKKVVFEEINMYQDDPESVCAEEFYKIFYAGTPLSKNILGTVETVGSLTREQILSYVHENYIGKNVVISVVGGMEFEDVKSWVEKYFLPFFKTKMEVDKIVKSNIIIPNKDFGFVKKDVMQSQIAFGFPCENVYSERRMAHILLSFIFGGGMGSRLFQKVREENGLVYSISCVPEQNQNGGDFVISFGTTPKNEVAALKLVKEEIDKVIEKGFSETELNRAKTYCKSIVVNSTELGLDIARANASNIASFGEVISIEKKIEDIEKVTLEELNNLALKIFDYSNICGAVVAKDPNKNLFDLFD